MTIGTTAVSYAVLALGYLTGRVKAKAPAWPWLAGVFALVLSPLVGFDWRTASGEDFAYLFSPLTYLCLAALILYEFRSKAANLNVVRRILDTTALISGCGLVLSSIFLNIATDSGGSDHWTGWSVVVRRGGWVTSGFNIGSEEGIKWLQAIYTYPAYVIYLIVLIATLSMIVCLAVSRFSMHRLQASRALGWFTAIFTFACLWVYTDIFWGWNDAINGSFDLAPWRAALTTALWAAGPLFALVHLAPIARGRSDVCRLQAVAIFQIPVAAFNSLMLPELRSGSVDVLGLALLMLGLLLVSSACMDLMIRRDAMERGTLPQPG
jgi:hypothetical protein